MAKLKQKSLYIYHSRFADVGGSETFIYNLVLGLWEYYDITVLYEVAAYKQIERLKPYCNIVRYNKNDEYVCDIFIRNSLWGDIPNNVISRDNKYIEMRHTDYKYLLDSGILKTMYTPLDNGNYAVGCGEFVAKQSSIALHEKCTPIQNILAPTKKTDKILHLISCTRLSNDKGEDRMNKLCELLRAANIKFDWKIFTNGEHTVIGEEIQYFEPRFDTFDYVADADYTVLLSSLEGLPYTVLESLQYKTPCIVTDIGGCTELIKDGKNGYVVPLDMNFDVKKLLKIPKLDEYDNHAKEKWLKYLGGGIYMKKVEKKAPEVKTIKMEAIDTNEYDKYDEIINITPKNGKLLGWVIAGDILEVTDEIAKDLEEKKLAKRIDG